MGRFEPDTEESGNWKVVGETEEQERKKEENFLSLQVLP